MNTLRSAAPARTSPRRSRKTFGRSPLSYAALALTALITLIPFFYGVVSSLRTTGQISSDPLGWPSPIAWENYTSIIGSEVFWRPLFNSVLVALITTALVVVCGSMVAFVIARIRFTGREGVYTFFTLGLLFPAAIAILPLYLLVRQLGLLDSPLGVALPQAAFALPMTVVILRPFLQGIPVELEDAASMDGVSRFGFFWRIVLPMATPALVTVSILALITSWNNYLLPLLILPSPEQWTLPLGVAQFKGTYVYDIARTLAYTILSIVPTLIAYGFGERYIVRGLMAGAVKG